MNYPPHLSTRGSLRLKMEIKFVNTDINKSIAELSSKLNHKTLVLWATDCAEHVLLHFQEEYPEDNRPQKAIEAECA